MAAAAPTFHEGFVSELIGRPAFVRRGDRREEIGKVADFVVGTPDVPFPSIDAVVLKTREGKMLVRLSEVAAVGENGSFELSAPPTIPAPPDDETLYLVEDLFDKRINDIEITRAGGALRVVAADIGISGLLRRLGVGRIAPTIVERVPRTLIAWDNVAPIADMNPSEIRLSVSQGRLSRLHPSDLADIVEELNRTDAARIVSSLDDEDAADTFEHLDVETQRELIESIGTERAADIIEEMDSDDAA